MKGCEGRHRQDIAVESVERTFHALFEAHAEIGSEGSAGLGGVGSDVPVELAVPDIGVSVRVFLARVGFSEGGDVGEGVDVLRVVDEEGEVGGEAGDEIGVEHDAGVAAEGGEVEGWEVRVVDDRGSGALHDLEGFFEGVHDGCCVFVHEIIDSVPWNANARAFEAGRIACFDVVYGRSSDGRVGRGPVVMSIWSGDGIQDIGSILDGPGHWPHSILAHTDGNDHAS